MECLRCGTCCVAPDIAALGKPLGVSCSHLLPEGGCAVYEERPLVCRGYRPDDICVRIAAPSLEERVANYLDLFGLAEEVCITETGVSLEGLEGDRAVFQLCIGETGGPVS